MSAFEAAPRGGLGGITSTRIYGTVVEALEYCPGNGTRYMLLLTPLPPAVAEKFGLSPTVGGCMVTWCNPPHPGDAYPFAWNAEPDGGYLEEKFRCGEADADALATLLAKLLKKDVV